MESFWFVDQLIDVLVGGEQTDGRLSLCEVLAPAGSTTPLHIHHREDEGFYVAEGELTVWVGDEEVVLHAGDFREAPKGVPRTIQNTGGSELRALVTSSPAGFEGFVRDYGEPAERHEVPVMEGPPDAERIAAVAAEHGIEILGPPGMKPSELG